MKTDLLPYLYQASFFGAVGMGIFALRKLTAKPLHSSVASCTEITHFYPAIAATLSEIAQISTKETELDALLACVKCIANEDRSHTSAAQWKISRSSSHAVALARKICKTSSHEDAFTVHEEVCPLLEKQLEDLLMNHLLSK